MTSVENLEFTEAFQKSTVCVCICLCRKNEKSICLSPFPKSLKAGSLKIHIQFLGSQMCQFSKYTFMSSGVIKQRMR